MGDAIGISLLAGQVIGGTIFGGLNAANSFCQTEAAAEDLKNKAIQFNQDETEAFNSLQAINANIQEQVQGLIQAQKQAMTDLAKSRVNYAISIRQMQLIAMCVIIVTFILLLGKKLKIY